MAPSVPPRAFQIVLSPPAMLALLVCINLLNYLDRGIVPGAFQSLGDYIQQDLSVNGTDSYIGALQSSFIGGYSVASISFGHLVHSYPPFRLMSVGLAIWVVSVVLSGLAPYFGSHNTFWVLIATRVLSGVGEASFQTVVPPYIDDNAPPAKRGLWLSLFYMAIPVGTAIGYAYGGFVAARWHWQWAFFLEAIPMVPMIAVVWFIPYNRHRREVIKEVEAALEADTAAAIGGGRHGDDAAARVGLLAADGAPRATAAGSYVAPARGGSHLSVHGTSHLPHHVPPTADEVEREVVDELAASGDTAALADVSGGKPSFWTELRALLGNPIYLSIVAGYAAFTGVVAGFGTFAPTVVLGFKLLSSQESASLSAGAMAAAAGAIGVPVGGWLIDVGQRRARARARRQAAALERARLLGADETAAYAEAHAPASLFDTPLPTALYKLTREGSDGSLQPAPGAPSSVAATAAAGSASGSSTATAPAATGGADDDDDATSPEVMDTKLTVSMSQGTMLVFAGSLALVAGIFADHGGVGAFLGVLGIGIVLLMGTTAGINLAMMASVPAESRSFAIGLGTLLVHALGDVPAPPIIGALIDWLAPPSPPGCSAATCVRDHDGLRDALLATASWLVWPIALWALAWLMASRRAAWRRDTGYYTTARIAAAAAAAAVTPATPATVTRLAGRAPSTGYMRMAAADAAPPSAAIPVARRGGGGGAPPPPTDAPLAAGSLGAAGAVTFGVSYSASLPQATVLDSGVELPGSSRRLG